MLFAETIKFSVSPLLNLDVNTQTNSQILAFSNFVDILEDFNHLWHYDDSLDNLFKDLRNLNNLFNSCVDWNLSLFNSVNKLNLFFNMINNIVGLDNLWDLCDFLSDDFNCFLFNSSDCDLYDLFLNNRNLNGYLLSHNNCHYLFYNSVNNLVNFDKLWNDSLKLNNLNLVNVLLYNNFNWDNSWNFNQFFNNLFDDLFYDLNIGSILSDDLWLLNIGWNLDNFILNNNFSFIMNCGPGNLDNFLNNLFNFDDLCLFDIAGDWLLDDFYWVDQFLLILNDLDRLFNNSLDFNWNLNNQCAWFLDLYQFFTLDNLRNDLFYNEFFRNFILKSDNLLNRSINDFFFLNNLFNWNNSFDNLLNWFFNLNVDIFNFLNFNWLFNFNNFLNNHLNFLDRFFFNYLFDNDLNNLRYFHNLFNDSWNNNNLFDNLLNFNDFGNFNKLFDNFFNSDLHLFDSFNCSWNLNNLLDNTLNDLNVFNVLNNRLLNLNNFGFVDDLLCEFLDWNNLRNMNFLNNDVVNDLRNLDNFLLDDRNFNSSINNFLNLNNLFNNDVINLLDFFDLDNWYKLFSNNLNFFDLSLNRSNWDWLLNYLGNLDKLLDNSLDWHKFLNIDWNFFDNLSNGYLSLSNDLYNFLSNNLLFNHFNFNNFWYFYNLFHNFLNINWYLDYLLNNLLNWNNLFLNFNNLSNFWNNMMNRLFNFNYLCVNNNSFNNLLDLDDFRNLDSVLNDLFSNGGNLNNFLGNCWNFY